MGVQRYARRDESIKGAEFALKKGKKKSWLKYVLVFGLIFFACWYERNFLAQAAEKIRKLPDWTIFIIIVLSLTYLVWEGTIIWLLTVSYTHLEERNIRCADRYRLRHNRI